MAQLNDLGIDLGTSNVLIYQQGKGLVLRRPAVVAIERSTKKVLAIGDDAQRMVGRTPSNIMAIRPLKQGTVADFELTNTMLRFFLNGVLSKRLFSGPRVVMSVPSGVTETEKHSLINILLDAGVKRTYLLDRPLAAALGVGMDLRQRYGRIINMSSIVGLRGTPGQANYCASKAGLIGLTKALAKEEGPSGITVNCVAPGVIDTDMMASFTAEDLSLIHI